MLGWLLDTWQLGLVAICISFSEGCAIRINLKWDKLMVHSLHAKRSATILDYRHLLLIHSWCYDELYDFDNRSMIESQLGALTRSNTVSPSSFCIWTAWRSCILDREKEQFWCTLHCSNQRHSATQFPHSESTGCIQGLQTFWIALIWLLRSFLTECHQTVKVQEAGTLEYSTSFWCSWICLLLFLFQLKILRKWRWK